MSSGNSEKRFELHAMQGGVCALCGRGLALEEVTLDHRFPKSRGGSHELFNLQAAHGSCNQAKANKVIVGFVPKEHLKDLSCKQLKKLVSSRLCDRIKQIGIVERDRMMEAMDGA